MLAFLAGSTQSPCRAAHQKQRRCSSHRRLILLPGSVFDIASGDFSLLAFSELRDLLAKVAECRLILPDGGRADLALLGTETDRAARNKLQSRWLANCCVEWLQLKARVHVTPLPQYTIAVKQFDGAGECAITGTWPDDNRRPRPHTEQAVRADSVRRIAGGGRPARNLVWAANVFPKPENLPCRAASKISSAPACSTPPNASATTPWRWRETWGLHRIYEMWVGKLSPLVVALREAQLFLRTLPEFVRFNPNTAVTG